MSHLTCGEGDEDDEMGASLVLLVALAGAVVSLVCGRSLLLPLFATRASRTIGEFAFSATGRTELRLRGLCCNLQVDR